MSDFLKIVIIGRTNVGKTTFFNKFCNQKLGIVSDFAGLTRDLNNFKLTIQNCNFEIFDTPGFEKDSIFFKKIQKQYFELIEKADLIMFFSDGKVGFLDEDRLNLSKIKKLLDKTILVVNKCENINKIKNESFENLPFKKIFKISAEHDSKFKEIFSFLFDLYKEKNFELNFNEQIEKKRIKTKAIIREIESNKENQKEENTEDVIKIAVIGRPNVGKSTFLNKILNENRLCTSEIAGTTRDAIKIPFQYKKDDRICNFEFIDTAGIRKKNKINDKIEKMSIQESIKNLDLANIIFFMTDAESAMEVQDLKLTNLILQEGRILIYVINKWDKINKAKEKEVIKFFNESIIAKISQVKGLSFFTISAINDKNFNAILEESIKLFYIWKKKISSRDLNKWLKDLNFSPFITNRKLKLKFIRQTNIKPQKFTIFANFSTDEIPINHYNYIRNELIKFFNLYSVPIRIEIKKQSTNPFQKSKNK